MNFKINNSYKISVRLNGTDLHYTCKITAVDEFFISFVDKFGTEYNYNKSLIMSVKELIE